MKLYWAPGTCALSPHIVAEEAGIPLQLEKVDIKAKKTASGQDYNAINPKGYVPALELDDGDTLTEGPAIVQYLADQKPGTAPAAGTRERYHLQEMLSYINSEIHKAYSPLFKPTTPEATRQERIEYLKKRYALLEQRLADHEYLVGEKFSPADAYLYTVTRWAGPLKIDLSAFPNLLAFQQRIQARPKVQAALKAEGIS
ncbi:MAG: glutathione transferase GstA [Gammaproteobacteria bacterium]|nr:glutathione transferase GstA [Gammaproteobacteria bacterium]